VAKVKRPVLKPSIIPKSLLWFFAFLFAGFLVYAPTLHNPFLLDDESQILNNAFVRNANWEGIFEGSTFNSFGQERPNGVYYKPLMSAIYAGLWELGDGSSFLFHLLQLILAILNAFLFYWLLQRWTLPIFAGLAALLFLLHPINSEVILYIADLQDTLFLFWGLLALYLFSIRRIPWAFSCSSILLCLLSKESGILFVIALPLFSLLFDKTRLRAAACASLFSFGFYAIFRFGFLGMTKLTAPVVPIARTDVFVRLLTFPQSAVHYLKLFWWPKTLSLQQNWIVTQAAIHEFYDPLFIFGLFFVVFVWILLKARGINRKVQLFFCVLLGCSFAVHSNIIIPLDATVAERWFYFGSLNLIALYTIILVKYFAHTRIRQYVLASLISVAIVACGIRSSARGKEWKDGRTLFSKEYHNDTRDFSMANSLGVEYLRLGDIDNAILYLRRATDLNPTSWVSWNNLGVAEGKKGDFISAENCFALAINKGQYPLSMENYALLLWNQRRLKELEGFLKEALLVLPKNSKLLELNAAALRTRNR
jgi:tetratricopeptide (TPR) repeat protein